MIKKIINKIKIKYIYFYLSDLYNFKMKNREK